MNIGTIAIRPTRRALSLFLALALCTQAIAADGPVTDENVDAAIQRAVAWIKSQRKKDHWEDEGLKPDSKSFYGGTSALAVLALLYAGEDPRSDDLSASLKWLAAQSIAGTYVHGVRAHALALVPGTYKTALHGDVEWLIKNVGAKGTDAAGAYDYWDREGNTAGFDHSNSQYGVLGCWMASDAGVNIPETYWQLVEEHWLKHQKETGGWGYRSSESPTGSMTAAGLATLFVVLEKAHAKDEGVFNGTSSAKCGQHREAGALIAGINRGLEWFAREFTTENPHGDGKWKNYYLYGIERIGRASGQKYFRERDWFREGAAELLKTQRPDGSWTGGDSDRHETCFALMFLCHGRAPLMFAKLQHGDDWNNKVRDVAGLTRYAEKRFERLLNWQIVTLKAPLADLLEAPVLYLSGHTEWEFSDEEVQKLREYGMHGGMLLGVACCSKDDFSKGFKAMMGRAFPEFAIKPVGDGHPLLSKELQSDVKDAPPMLEVSNGVRTLAILSTKDICAPWNQGHRARWDNYFNLGCNIYLYATDKSSIRSRLQSVEIAPKQGSTRRTIQVARIKYKGMWDPEPHGWQRLATYMANETGTRLDVVSGVALDSADLARFKIAHITGTAAFELSAGELAGLRKFLFGGGTLLADATGGSAEFGQALEKAIAGVVNQELRFVEKDEGVLTGAGIADAVTLEGVEYRRVARREGRGQKFPRLRVFDMGHRLGVVFSPFDVSAGLLGTNIYNVRGFESDSCLKIARNMLLYAALPTADKAKLGKHGG